MKFNFEQQPGKTLSEERNHAGEPLITIVTPFYNAARHFEQTFICVENQTFPWFEWIIVDDGSDKEADVRFLEKITAKDERIRVLHKENGGISSARNRGIREAQTAYILPLDADDLIEPTFLEYCWWMLQKNPDAAWAVTDSCGFGGQEYLWFVPFDPDAQKTTNRITATCLIRKAWIEKVGGYEEKEKYFNEDWYLWLNIMSKGGKAVQTQREALFWYRRSDQGVLSKVHKDPHIARRNQELIKTAASQIIEAPKPIIYPKDAKKQEIHPPIRSSFERKVYKGHEKTNVLFIVPWLMMGGADQFNLDVMRLLDRDRFNAVIVTTVACENEWLQRFREYTDEIYNLPNFMAESDYPEFISYLIQTRDIDTIFLSNSYLGYYLLPWLRKSYPEIGIVDYVHMEEWYWRQGGYARTSGVMGSLVDKTYVCNSATEHVLEQHFHRPEDSVETLHIGIDEKRYDPSLVPEGLVYQKLGIDRGRPIVLFICRFHPQKRPFLMIKIAEEVRRQIPDAAFVAVGDGDQREEMEEKVSSLGLGDTVYFVGAVEETRPYYRDAAVTLICSLKEGLSLTAYESLAMGVPVVSSDVGGQKDLIDQEVGRLIPLMQDEEKDFDRREFPSEEIKQFADAIADLLRNKEKRAALSRQAREKVTSGFTLRHMIDRLESELSGNRSDQKLLEKRRKASQALNILGDMASDHYRSCVIMENEEMSGEEEEYLTFRSRSRGELGRQLWECQKQLSSHEEVISRHEEVVCRHEKSINHQWEVQKWHEERIKRLEKRRFPLPL